VKNLFALVALAAIAVATVPVAGLTAEQENVYDLFEIELTVDPASVAAGNEGVLLIKITIPFGYTMTDDKNVFSIQPAPVEGIMFDGLEKPPYSWEADGIGHWAGIKTFRLPFGTSADIESGTKTIRVQMVIQACDDSTGLCYLPAKFSKSVELQVY
jgi:hypothetical protein